jgi:hypothetical protein
MAKTSKEYENFSKAMDTILKADPAKVRAQMEAEKKQRKEQREEKATSSSREGSETSKA